MSWYHEAQKSENSKVKELLKAYQAETDKSNKKALRDAMLLVLGIKADEEENPEELNQVVEEIKEEEDLNKKNNSFSFPETIEEVAKIDDIEVLEKIFKLSKEKTKEIELTRLKHETFKQKKEMDRKIWAIRRVGFAAHSRAYNKKMFIKKKESQSKISMIHKKRQIFINLIRQGVSFSQICVREDGLKKEELTEIVNIDVLNACKPYMMDVVGKWAKWCQANLEEVK